MVVRRAAGWITLAVAVVQLMTSNGSTDDPITLAAMTFNIRYGTANDGPNGWEHRRELVASVVRDHDPDVVGLQEALRFQLEALLEDLPAYASVGVGRSDGKERGEFAAILFRTERFEVAEHGTFWFSDTPGEPGSTSWGNDIERICTWARLVDRKTKCALYVYNVHLDHRSQPSREKSTALLAERILARKHEDPFIVTGDFNAAPDNPAITDLVARLPGLTDCFRQVNEPSDAEGTFNGFTGKCDGARIDYIFAGKGVTTLSSSIVRDDDDGRYPSDHDPVIAEIRIGDR